MYPLYRTNSKGGYFMRYTYQFKRDCVESLRNGSCAAFTVT